MALHFLILVHLSADRKIIQDVVRLCHFKDHCYIYLFGIFQCYMDSQKCHGVIYDEVLKIVNVKVVMNADLLSIVCIKVFV